MRSKKAFLNIIVELILESFTILSGFIIPQLIIKEYGSDVNGLIVTITQYFGYLTLLQSGIGGVAKAALYKPLSERDNLKISSYVKAIENFFKKIGYISVIYLIFLAIFFPTVIYVEESFLKTALLVFIIWIGIFGQYYFGATYQFLLQADQRYYIYSITQIIVVIINTIVSIFLIKKGFSIYSVKLLSSIIFLIRPFLLNRYCKKVYKINNHILEDASLIKQRWDGFGHTIAYFIHSKADIFLLSAFSTLTNVSIYSVYSAIVTGLSLLLNTIANSVQAAFGNMIAKNETRILNKNYHVYVCVNSVLIMILFSTGIITIIPFIKLYSVSFNNIDYINPIFSFFLMLAEAIFCIRMPYQMIVLAAGHYKQTKKGAFIESLINIIISILLVKKYGLLGVTVGTIIAMSFRTIQYIRYLSINIIKESMIKQLYFFTINIFYLIFAAYISLKLNNSYFLMRIDTYLKWIIYAFLIFLISSILSLIIIILIDKDSIKEVFWMIRRVLKNNKKRRS